ncbi:MAG TPA: bi-domain-containing oxidoreductase [Streptosporangiales bacterium]
MKQVAQNYRSGELTVLDVPRPACAPGGVLVRSLFSLISTGTELMKVGEAKLSLVGKARARPDQVRKVIDSALQQGAVNTYKKVMNRLDSYTPLGYSLCGVVTDVGAGAEEFSVGQVVACAGNEYALHAEYNWVPVNMCVAVPDGVPPEQAAFATVGAIAMHGVRRSEVQLGDAACVVGLGLVGQLAVRLLVASGVRVFGLDVVADRCRQAEKAGAILCASPGGEDLDRLERAIAEATAGAGADHVLIAAGGPSNGPVEVAARLARDRARVVDIGKTKLDLPWNAYYDKELDVRFSRSYGPGRYDERYEVDGVDYPIGYVRWTERRNLACFLDLIAREQLDVGSLVSRVFPIADAADAYQQLRTGSVPGVGFLFEYPAPSAEETATTAVTAPAPPRRTTAARTGRLRFGFIGAGNYASSMLLPHLAKDESVALARVVTQRSLSAATAQRRFGFETVSTDVDAVLDDSSLDAVFVVTRHSTHAELTCRALERGHTVFVEKPLALTDEDVDRIAGVVASTGNDRVMVGFNRRFAPLFTELRDGFGTAPGGAVARYLVNAGRLDAGSWYLSGGEGTRFVGEGGHFIDTLGWWFDSLPVEVYAVGGPEAEDVSATLRFADGSVGQVAYLTGGNARFPKETFDATARGRNARLDNFQRTALWTGRRPRTTRARGGQDKGQRRELRAFVDAVRGGGPLPIPFESVLATTRATIAVARSLASGRPEQV